MDLLTYLSFFIFGYWVASKIIAFQMQFMIRRLAKEHNIDISDLDEETEDKPVAIPILITESVDKHGIFLYDGKNNFIDRKSTRLNSSHIPLSRMPSSA